MKLVQFLVINKQISGNKSKISEKEIGIVKVYVNVVFESERGKKICKNYYCCNNLSNREKIHWPLTQAFNKNVDRKKIKSKITK